MVFVPAAIVTPSPGGASSLTPVPNHGYRVYEDAILPVESLEPAPWMDKGKQLEEEGFQRKRKWAMSVESDESILEEGLMEDVRCAGREEEFFRINLDANSTGQLTDVVDHYRQLCLRLCFPVHWLNECLSKADWKELRQCGQGLPSLCDTMVYFY